MGERARLLARRWSGDGFYFRGHHNLIVDCEAYDCFRWAYTTCHENDIANLHEHLSLTWRSGQVVLEYQPPAAPDGKPAPRRRLGIRQIPGPDSPAVQRKDEPLDLTVVVPEPGGEVRVYLQKARPEGETDCTFPMPDHLKSGSFGFIDHKWYSYVYLGQLSYSP